jgi:hypothetical protein
MRTIRNIKYVPMLCKGCKHNPQILDTEMVVKFFKCDKRMRFENEGGNYPFNTCYHFNEKEIMEET